MKCEFCPRIAVVFGFETNLCNECYGRINVQIREIFNAQQEEKERKQPGSVAIDRKSLCDAIRLQPFIRGESMDQEEKFRSLTAKAGEYFEDYVIIARTPDVMYMKSSDETWAAGACFRYADFMANNDKFNVFKFRSKENE